MILLSIFYDPNHLRIAFIILAGLFAVLAIIIHFARRRSKSYGGDPTQPSHPSAPLSRFRDEGSLLAGFFRSLLVLLSCVVGIGFILIVLPQSTVEQLSQSLRLRQPPPDHQDLIAFLYLGDEVRTSDFHIRGVIRNITTEPIENIDATVRLFSSEGRIIETAIVRLDRNVIAPDATASFHLRYPDYRGQFTSYSVQFKLRDGEPVPYKDMRGAREP